jgi:SOS response associated peptidase (SRAP)
MCGRAKLPDDVSEIKLDLKIDLDEIGDYRPRWNAAPTSNLPVVISHNRQRILTLMRWGLVPSWAKDLKIGYSTFKRPRRNHRRPKRLPRRMACRTPLPCHRRRLLRVARPRQTALRRGAWQSRADDPRRPMGILARAERRHDQILRHRHDIRQRPSCAAA